MWKFHKDEILAKINSLATQKELMLSTKEDTKKISVVLSDSPNTQSKYKKPHSNNYSVQILQKDMFRYD